MDHQNIESAINNELYYLAGLAGCTGIGSKFMRLLELASPRELWEATPQKLADMEILSSANIASFVDSRKKIDIEKLTGVIDKSGIKISHIYAATYPPSLKNLYKPPVVLFYKGKYGLDIFGRAIAVVGTREPTEYGIRATRDIVSSVAAENINIVSGMALGIDSEAHKSAIDAGGITTAVLGCGLNIVYPSSNRRLYERIIENGIVVSEFIPTATPQQWHFPQRNRIISGLAKGVVVIEGSHDSGSISTVEHALEQGKPVFALPGSIYTKQSEAPNKLIKEGAIPILSYRDILNEMGWGNKEGDSDRGTTKSDNKQSKLSNHIENLIGIEKSILETFKSSGESTLSVEHLYQQLGLSPSEINTALLQLELSDILTKKSGGLYSLLE